MIDDDYYYHLVVSRSCVSHNTRSDELLLQNYDAVESPRPLLAVPNVTGHASTASVRTSYYLLWHYNYWCPLKG